MVPAKNRECPVLFSAGGSDDPFDDFALDGQHKALRFREFTQQFCDKRRTYGIGNIGDDGDFIRIPPGAAHHVSEVQCEDVALDQSERLSCPIPPAKPGGKAAVMLDGDDVSRPGKKLAGKRPETGPHFDNGMSLRQTGTIHDPAGHRTVDEKRLTAALARPDIKLR
jgi:hypothetical protein